MNKKNQKYRDRFDCWVNVWIPKVAGKKRWSEIIRCHNRISDYREDTNNEEADLVIPPADEAIIVLMLENCATKWPYTWKCLAKEAEPNKEAKEMETLYSCKASGHSNWGGWNEASRLRFGKLRSMIAKGRAAKTTKKAEEQCRLRLFDKHGMEERMGKRKKKTPKPPKIDLTNAAVGFKVTDEGIEFGIV